MPSNKNKKRIVVSDKTLYAEVAPAVPVSNQKAQTFTYQVSQKDVDVIKIYSLVKIPFGPRRLEGIVLKLHTDKPPYRTRELDLVRTPLGVIKQQVALGQWISKTMNGGLGFTLRLFYPPKWPKKGSDEISGILSPLRKISLTKDARHYWKNKQTNGAFIESDVKKRSRFLRDLAYLSLSENKQILIIVPEITQLEKMQNAYSDIPEEYVSMVHAGMSQKELRLTWQKVQTGLPQLIIGTQKALFLPFANLAEIALEEDYFSAHKLFDQYPRLSNIYAARQLAEIHNARLTVSSSFVSLRTRHLIDTKAINPVTIHAIEPRIVPFAFSFEDRKKKHLLPAEFTQKLSAWLHSKKKIFVLYNRRGTWQMLACKACKTAVRCKECGVAMIVNGKYIECHHCNVKEEMPKVCPSCKKKGLQPMKPGGEIMTQVFKAFNKRGSLVRLDADTIKEKTEAAIQKDITKANVVVGTIAAFKYLQEKQFQEVVWLYPEQSLLYPDARSTERCMYLLARLQQLLPAKKAVTTIVRQPQVMKDTLDMPIKAFYEKQLKERKRLFYPPFADLIRLTVGDKKKEKALTRAEKLRDILEQRLIKAKKKVIIRGPFQGYVKAKKGKQEAHLLLQGSIADISSLYSDLAIDTVDLDPSRIL